MLQHPTVAGHSPIVPVVELLRGHVAFVVFPLLFARPV